MIPKSTGNPKLRPILIIFGLLLLLTSHINAQNKDEKMILEILKQEEIAWSSGDIDSYVEFYAPLDSTRMILSKGAVYGKKNILEFYKKYWPKEKMGRLKLINTTMEKLSNEYYYVCGNFQVSYPDAKSVEGRYSSLMKKINGKWYIYTDHSG